MKYRGIFEYEYPTEHKPPISIDVYLHGDCVKGKIIEWEYRPLEQEPQSFKWCTDCKEYDTEKHCCHRYSKVIRNTVAEIRQEPFKPMVEIDLYSVIKQKYIEREVLGKIRAEIENDWQLKKYPSSPFSCGLRRAIEIIDKYKAESEEQEDGNDD